LDLIRQATAGETEQQTKKGRIEKIGIKEEAPSFF
jgi:hypothetical protein